LKTKWPDLTVFVIFKKDWQLNFNKNLFLSVNAWPRCTNIHMFWTINTNKYTKISKNTKSVKLDKNMKKCDSWCFLHDPNDPNDHYEQPFGDQMTRLDSVCYF